MTDKVSPLKIRKWERAANIIGFIMSLISMLFTVRLMKSFATDSTSALLYQAFGCTVQAAQVILFVYAVYLQWQRQNGKAVTAFILFCLLFILSLAGTLGSFIVSNKIQNNQELNSDVRLKELQKRAESIDDQISNSQNLIERFAKKAIITKGVKPESARLDRLNSERSALSDQISTFKTEGTSDSLYTGLSQLLGIEAEKVKLWLFGLYAVALDLVSAVLLAFSIGVLGTMTEGAHTTMEDAPAVAGFTAHTPGPAFNTVPASVRTEAENPKQPIGFTTNPKPKKRSGTLVDQEIIQQYIRAAYRGQDRPKSLRGRRAVADEIGINNDDSDYVHNLLKRKKIVEVRGKRTFPRKSMAEALSII